MSDHLYYYKQSIGMLGFAAIGGQFPNVLEDMRSNPVIGTTSVGFANHGGGSVRCRRVFGGVLISVGREDGIPGLAGLFDASGRAILSGRIVPAQTSEGNRRTFFFSTAGHIDAGVVVVRIATSDGKVLYQRQMPLASSRGE